MKKKGSKSSLQKRIFGLLGIFVVLAMLSATIAVAGERIGNDPIAKGTNTDIVIQSPDLVTYDLNSGLTPTDLVNTLLGGGVAVSNVTYSGVNIAAGNFSGGTGIIGFEGGIILSSGNISSVKGPNVGDGTTTNNSLPGDADLNALIPGYTTYDATVLEFDFVPTSSVVTFQYVFGSEEYNEYVNTAFNDVFGFFVNGINVALIPGTSTPVSINNVNGGGPIFGTNPNNSAYYINNDLTDGGPFFDTELDGLTVVLTATVNVNTGVNNHIKLAIADAGDHILDSDVFIKAASFTAPLLTLTPLTATNPTGSSHMLTATLVDANGNPVSGETITFTVTAGPNVGVTGTNVTDSNGVATFSYTGTTAGTDTIVATSAGQVSNNAFKTWEVPPTGSISGMKFNDLNGNSTKDIGEPGLTNWTIMVTGSMGTMSTLTDSYGNYMFGGLIPGTYIVAEVLQPGWVQTAPPGGTYTVTVSPGMIVEGLDFGNVIDIPEASCVPTVNPSGSNIPTAGDNPKSGQNPDGFYELLAVDLLDPNPMVYVKDAGSSTIFGPFPSGTKMKYTESSSDPVSKTIGGPDSAVDWHIKGNGDAKVYAVNVFGMTSPEVDCLVPPPPK